MGPPPQLDENMENTSKMDDDWGYPYDSGNLHIFIDLPIFLPVLKKKTTWKQGDFRGAHGWIMICCEWIIRWIGLREKKTGNHQFSHPMQKGFL